MARKQKRTLSSKTGVSETALSRKIATVKREDPSLTNRQAVGKAAGILLSEALARKRGKR